MTLSSPKFLFEFKNQNSNESQYFIAADISTATTSYNRFIVTETASPNSLIGEVYLLLEGRYDYIVREQASTTNLDPALSGAIVEKGLVKVGITDPTNNTYTTSRVNTVYNG